MQSNKSSLYTTKYKSHHYQINQRNNVDSFNITKLTLYINIYQQIHQVQCTLQKINTYEQTYNSKSLQTKKLYSSKR